MEQFTPKTITLLLLVGIVIYLAVRDLKHYCDRVDAEWSAKNPPLFPPELNDAGPVPPVSARQKDIAAAHVAKILPASLRTSLPYIRKAERYATAAKSEGGHHD